LSIHLSDLLLLNCHCIVCPSLRFAAPHLPLYYLSISLIYERWTDNTMTIEEQ
jgi:hypothetical protein